MSDSTTNSVSQQAPRPSIFTSMHSVVVGGSVYFATRLLTLEDVTFTKWRFEQWQRIGNYKPGTAIADCYMAIDPAVFELPPNVPEDKAEECLKALLNFRRLFFSSDSHVASFSFRVKYQGVRLTNQEAKFNAAMDDIRSQVVWGGYAKKTKLLDKINTAIASVGDGLREEYINKVIRVHTDLSNYTQPQLDEEADVLVLLKELKVQQAKVADIEAAIHAKRSACVISSWGDDGDYAKVYPTEVVHAMCMAFEDKGIQRRRGISPRL